MPGQYGAVLPPQVPQSEQASQSLARGEIASTTKLCGHLAEYINAESKEIEYYSISQILDGEIEDMSNNDSFIGTRIRMLKKDIVEQNTVIEGLATNETDSATTATNQEINEALQKLIQRKVVGFEASARMEAYFAQQDHSRLEAILESYKGRRSDKGENMLLHALGEEEYARIRDDINAKGSEEKSRFSLPNRFASVKTAAKCRIKRSGSKALGLIHQSRSKRGKDRPSKIDEIDESMTIADFRAMHKDVQITHSLFCTQEELDDKAEKIAEKRLQSRDDASVRRRLKKKSLQQKEP